MNGRIISMLAVLSFCFLMPVSNDAAGLASHGPEISASDNKRGVLTKPFVATSSFVNTFRAKHFIRTKSSCSLTSWDVFAGPYKLFLTKPDNKNSVLETYAMMLASLGLMMVIAYRRVASEEE